MYHLDCTQCRLVLEELSLIRNRNINLFSLGTSNIVSWSSPRVRLKFRASAGELPLRNVLRIFKVEALYIPSLRQSHIAYLRGMYYSYVIHFDCLYEVGGSNLHPLKCVMNDENIDTLLSP